MKTISNPGIGHANRAPVPAGRPRRPGILLGVLLVLVGGGALGQPTSGAADLAWEPLEIQTASGRHRFEVEVADTPAERRQGLKYRRSLAADRGMLFDFRRGRRVAMWMADTYLPLDMVFIDARGCITRIVTETTPLSRQPIPSGGPIRAVLELAGGQASERGIEVGDRVTHPLFQPEAEASSRSRCS